MINPVHYNLLPLRDKADLLKERGEFIEAIASDDYDVSLYNMDGEYIELFYSIAYDKIEEIKVVEDLNRLEVYTWHVNIGRLLND
jgi:hypothetical protein